MKHVVMLVAGLIVSTFYFYLLTGSDRDRIGSLQIQVDVANRRIDRLEWTVITLNSNILSIAEYARIIGTNHDRLAELINLYEPATTNK